jgi:predicted metalloprotease with PDZ domain
MKQRNSLKLLLISLIASIMLHVFIALKYQHPIVDNAQNTQQSKKQHQQQDLDDGKTSIWASPGIVPCDSYDGIGVQFNGITGIVSDIAVGAPADKAGIRVGDELITPLWNMQLAFGQSLDVIVLRDGKKITLHVVVDRICHG